MHNEARELLNAILNTYINIHIYDTRVYAREVQSFWVAPGIFLRNIWENSGQKFCQKHGQKNPTRISPRFWELKIWGLCDSHYRVGSDLW